MIKTYCDKCGKLIKKEDYNYEKAMRVHLLSEHLGKKIFCEECQNELDGLVEKWLNKKSIKRSVRNILQK